MQSDVKVLHLISTSSQKNKTKKTDDLGTAAEGKTDEVVSHPNMGVCVPSSPCTTLQELNTFNGREKEN